MEVSLHRQLEPGCPTTGGWPRPRRIWLCLIEGATRHNGIEDEERTDMACEIFPASYDK